jgi:PKD repeat protein
MFHRRSPLALALVCVLAFLASTAQAANTCSPVGYPIKLSPSKHYFETYTTAPTPLVGFSHEYLCHIPLPASLQAKYCSLQNYSQRFTEMANARNNVIRIETIFNHSPGTEISTGPFTDEQPFNRSDGKWVLSTVSGSQIVPAALNPKYLENLDDVLCDAYGKGIVVEVSLFNVWDGNWASSPFNPLNAHTVTVNNVVKPQGFTAPEYFMTDSQPTAQDQQARNAQLGAVAAIVNRLKKYPNVIWEIANEPDFIRLSGVTKAQVFAWEKRVIDTIVNNDPDAAHVKSAHLIEVEGHSSPTFAWNDSRASIESAHYVDVGDAQTYGAISLLLSLYGTISSQGVAVGLNETRTFPITTPPPPNFDPDDVQKALDARPAAWEFALAGGALFDGYSINYADPETPKLRTQLKRLADFLYPQGTVGPRYIDDMRQTSCNNPGAWCTGVPTRDAIDTQGSAGCRTAKAYWSTLKAESDPFGFDVNDYALYIHHAKIVHSGFAGYQATPCGDGSSTGYQLPNLKFQVPRTGCYLEWWMEPETGMVRYNERRDLQANLVYQANGRSTFYKQDMLVFLTLLGTGSCFGDPPLTASYTVTCDYVWCNFDASASSPSSVISRYDWDWGDGTSSSSGTPTELHVFPTPGSRNVTLTVSDLLGDVGSTTQTLAVTSEPPTPVLFVNCSALTCTFDASSSRAGSAAVTHWSWSFGDGSGGSGVAPTHTFAMGGSYPVTLTVTDDFNVSSSLTQTVSVNGPPPTASFTVICSGLSCDFDAGSSTAGNPITYSWSFGDGTSGSGVSVSHAYAVKGTYSATLTVTDTIARQSTFLKVLTVTSDPPLPAESYFALPPCRALDTRIAPLTALNSGQTYSFQIAGKCGIPSTAKAVSFSVTAVAPTGAGTIALFPSGQIPVFNILDFDPARSPRATNTIAQLATSGNLGVLATVAGTSSQVHLVLDVDGYFSEDTTPAAGAQGPLGYQTITPCRLVDTRTTNTPLTSGVLRTFSIQGNCGIPVGAAAAALNAAVVSPTNLGYLALYPSSLPTAPVVSNLNWVAGTTALTNGARPMLSATTPSDLATKLFLGAPGTTAHLVLDTMGYFKSGAPYKYYPVAPCRAAHTGIPGEGAPSLAAGTTRSFQIQGNCGVPVGAKAAFISTKVLAAGTTTGGLLLLFPSGGSSNGTAFANFDAGEPALAGGAIVELSNNLLDISVSSSSNLDLSIKVLGYFQ